MATLPTQLLLTKEDLAEAREELGLLIDGVPMSQERFADFLGVSVMTVSRWERGVHAPSQLSRNAIRAALVEARQLNTVAAAHLGTKAVRKIDKARGQKATPRPRAKDHTAQAVAAP